MTYIIIKAVLSGIISEVSHQNPGIGRLIASLPSTLTGSRDNYARS
jgi:hypothetical protein